MAEDNNTTTDNSDYEEICYLCRRPESKAGKIQIIENGTAVDYSEEKATEILSQEEVKAVADVKMGSESATAWGCDLTHGYIDINADYRS